jgi:hypothetical protein
MRRVAVSVKNTDALFQNLLLMNLNSYNRFIFVVLAVFSLNLLSIPGFGQAGVRVTVTVRD